MHWKCQNIEALMKKDEDSDGMWCLVMFDLPVKT